MNTGDQARTLMAALDLAPDRAETEKQQLAIECALAEAVHRQKIAGRCPACGRDELFIGAGGALTCTNADCPDPARLHDLLTFKRLSERTAANTGHEVDAAPAAEVTEESDANAARRFAREVLELKETLGEVEGRAEYLEEQAARLVRHLDGSDGFPPAWWLEAADAVYNLRRIATEDDGV